MAIHFAADCTSGPYSSQLITTNQDGMKNGTLLLDLLARADDARGHTDVNGSFYHLITFILVPNGTCH